MLQRANTLRALALVTFQMTLSVLLFDANQPEEAPRVRQFFTCCQEIVNPD